MEDFDDVDVEELKSIEQTQIERGERNAIRGWNHQRHLKENDHNLAFHNNWAPVDSVDKLLEIRRCPIRGIREQRKHNRHDQHDC